MKTTVVPAQITSVEDRIAGSMTFPQIVLLIVPLLIGTLIYVCMPTRVHLSIIKIILISLQFIFFALMAVRFRGKIIAEWLIIYIRFTSRPRRYIFTKNDISARDVGIVQSENHKDLEQQKPKHKIVPSIVSPNNTGVGSLLDNPGLTVSFKLAKKGGLDVSLKPIKQ